MHIINNSFKCLSYLIFISFIAIACVACSNQTNGIFTENKPASSTIESVDTDVNSESAETQVIEEPVAVEPYPSKEALAIYREATEDFDGCLRTQPPQNVMDACRNMNGYMQPMGISGCYGCNVRYPDAGKVCYDSSECQGRSCRVTNSSRTIEGKTNGECLSSSSSSFACYSAIEDGKIAYSMCVD